MAMLFKQTEIRAALSLITNNTKTELVLKSKSVITYCQPPVPSHRQLSAHCHPLRVPGIPSVQRLSDGRLRCLKQRCHLERLSTVGVLMPKNQAPQLHRSEATVNCHPDWRAGKGWWRFRPRELFADRKPLLHMTVALWKRENVFVKKPQPTEKSNLK